MNAEQDRQESQQSFLSEAKAELGLTWDELAEASGITPRALKNYRMPEESQNHRGMPKLARLAIERLLEDRAKKARRKPA